MALKGILWVQQHRLHSNAGFIDGVHIAFGDSWVLHGRWHLICCNAADGGKNAGHAAQTCPKRVPR